ncbi:MAG TPA: ABC transporter ATP-binding protein [Lachnospiraceae bacterium]|nr:ABC transporter ATP-binding protein [Lachnospiraceae bacterium]
MNEIELIKQFKRKNQINYSMTIVTYILASISNIVGAFLLKQLTDVASGGTMKELYGVIIFCALYLLLLATILLLKRTFVNNYIYKAISQYKNYCFGKLLKKNMNALDKDTTGKYISIFTNDVNTIEASYVQGNISIIAQIITLIGAVAAMAYLNIILMLCVLAVSSLPILVSALFSEKLARKEKETSDRNEGFVGMVKDLLSGFSVIKSFKAEKEVKKLFLDRNDSIESVKNEKRKTTNIIELLSAIASFSVEVVTFGVGAFLSIKGIITAGTVIAFIQLLNYVLGPVSSLGPLFAARKAAKTLIHKMADTIRVEEDQNKSVEKSNFQESIRMDNVTFGYDEENAILKNITLCLEKGKSYIIVGSSGSGKSTLVNLILGHYGSYEGSIYIDDTNLNTIKDKCLSDLYSVIQQNVFIFDNTIEKNITMFQDFEHTDIDNAIEKSGLSKLIQEKGIDYHCGENGSFLSGGEKQRISIARSLIRKAPVLVMDEATSALDPVTAKMVETEISKLDGITRIVISHKLEESILRMYDEIIVLNGGRIAEKGCFDKLMEEKGYFTSLYQVTKA